MTHMLNDDAPSQPQMPLPEIQPDEPKASAIAFVAYCLMEDRRSLARVSGLHLPGCSSATVHRYSSRYRWVERAKQYDQAMVEYRLKLLVANRDRLLQEARAQLQSLNEFRRGLPPLPDVRAHLAALRDMSAYLCKNMQHAPEAQRQETEPVRDESGAEKQETGPG